MEWCDLWFLYLSWNPASPLWAKIHSPVPLLPPTLKPDNPLCPYVLVAYKIWGVDNFSSLKHNTDRIMSISTEMSLPHIFSTHPGQILFRGCAGEEVSGGKTDSGMKQQVRGNWISSTLHTTRSHTRLTVVHAKDAQTLAKVFLQRSDIGMLLVYMSLSSSDMQSSGIDVLLCWSGTWGHFCTDLWDLECDLWTHLNVQLSQLILELLWVCCDCYRSNLCRETQEEAQA